VEEGPQEMRVGKIKQSWLRLTWAGVVRCAWGDQLKAFWGVKRVAFCAVRRALLSIFAAAAVAVGSMSACAEELPSLRENIRNLQGLLQERQFLQGNQPFPQLPSYQFNRIVPGVTGLGELAQFGLADGVTDKKTLNEFAGNAVKARLRELGVDHEIDVDAPPSDFPRVVSFI
jgi:hypothetical protein